MDSRPLAGVRVLDLTWVLAGPYGTMMLSDLGADVVKVERVPNGDPVRQNGPFVGSMSTYFASINRGKRSIGINLREESGKALFLKLAAQADVVTENFLPGTMQRLGLGYDVLSRLNPRLIYAATSGFGQTGPYKDRPAYDVIVQGMAGTMSITGTTDGAPVRVGYSVGDLAAGMFTALGVLAALHERTRSDRGQYLDISMLESQMALLENAFVRYFAVGDVPSPLGTRHPIRTPVQAFPTRDGWIVVAVHGREDWVRLCAALQRRDLADDARFAGDADRHRNHAELEPLLSSRFRARTTAEWVALLEQAGVAAGPVNHIDEVAADPHVAARGILTDVPLPEGGTLRMVGHPVHYSRTPVSSQGAPPTLGQHTEAVLNEWLHMPEEAVRALQAQGAVV